MSEGAVKDFSTADGFIKAKFALLLFSCVVLIVILGITSATLHVVKQTSITSSSASSALGLPNIESYTWSDILNSAKGQTVEFWSSTADGYNEWIDDFLTPQMLSLYSINVVRIPMAESGAGQATAQIAAEKAAGNDTTGRVGLVWTNGPDYLAERSQGLLYGPWATKVPNAANFNFGNPGIAFDFGHATEGYEFPYNAAQITFIYNPNCPGMASPPPTMAQLVTWILSYPGRFTYANPSLDYTGSAFIRHFLYEFAGGYTKFVGSFNLNVYKQYVPLAFAKLRQIVPGILQQNGIPFYPTNQTDVDNLFASNEICLTVSYDPEHAGELVHVPQPPGILNFPNGTKTYLPSTGTIGNVNFVAISYNAQALFGALVTANFIGSMGAQFSRRQINPPGIGAEQVYDPNCDAVVSGGWGIAFAQSPDYPETPSQAALSAAFVPEVDSNYANQMQIDWILCVVQNQTTATGNTAFGPGSGASCF